MDAEHSYDPDEADRRVTTVRGRSGLVPTDCGRLPPSGDASPEGGERRREVVA